MSETVDLNIREYTRHFSERSIYSDDVVDLQVQHEFLNLSEEAALEQKSLFSDHANTLAIQTLMKLYDDQDRTLASSVVVASIGTSSTQVYTANRVVAAYFIGSAALADEPERGPLLLRSLFGVLERCSLIASPLIICDSFGYFVSETVLLQKETSETLLSKVSQDNLDAAKGVSSDRPAAAGDSATATAGATGSGSAADKSTRERHARQCQLLHSMWEFVNQYANAPPVFIQAATARPKIRKSWLHMKARQLANDAKRSRGPKADSFCFTGPAAPEGIYLVDFGGGGARLFYYQFPGAAASASAPGAAADAGDNVASAADGSVMSSTTSDKASDTNKNDNTLTESDADKDLLVSLGKAPKQSMGMYARTMTQISYRRW
jgi:hypothetical protein